MNKTAIAIKGKRAWVGILNDTSFTPESEIDTKTYSMEGYVPLLDYLRQIDPKITKKESEEFRKTIGYTKILVFMSETDNFWAYYNHKCLSCTKKCKQSSKVEVCFCPLYVEKK